MFWRLWPGNGLKWEFSLQTISRLTWREREREPSTLTSPIYEPIDLRTDHAFDFANFADHAFDFTNFSDHAFNFADQRTNLWTHEPIFDPRTFNFAGDLEPSRHEPIFDPEPRTHEPISFSMWFWSTHKPMSLWSLIFFCCCCGGVGGGVLMVFLLCGGGYCVGGGGK